MRPRLSLRSRRVAAVLAVSAALLASLAACNAVTATATLLAVGSLRGTVGG